ncbi:MAG TPA: hypothetical protein VM511_11450 [Luteolibacter sp.]|nr:hypothetical protein [Luteolibacter sp.]
MQPPDSIEAMLDRLMPTAISEKGQRSLDEMLDELCGPEIVEAPVVRRNHWKYAVAPVGIAAAVAVAVFLPGKETKKGVSSPAVVAIADEEFSLVGESDRIEALADEGLVADPMGGVMQAMRVRVVGENTFRDEETGIVMQISEPREEMLFYQVNAF